MRFIHGLAASAALLSSMPAFAAAVVSTDTFGPTYTVDAKARWGGTGQESILLTPDGPSGLTPAGTPFWTSGQTYNFRLDYTVATGTTNWSIDFNRNGSYGAGEVLTDAVASLAGKGFTYVNLLLTGSTGGSSVALTNFSVNGTNFGSYSNSTNTNSNVLFEDSSGLFGNLLVTGTLAFTKNGNDNTVAQERPRLYVSLGAPLTPPAVPEPATWAMMILGFGVVGAAARRRRGMTVAA